MLKYLVVVLAVFGLIISGVEGSDYILGTGDTLEISVYGQAEADLSTEAIIRPDGKISFPLIDDVRAAGLTPKELDEVITEKLSKRIPNPEVTVFVTSFPSSEYQVYVLGEVDGPGIFPIQGKITLLKAVTLAGGPTQDAYLDKIHIVRKGEKEPTFMAVNFKDIMHRGQDDITLEPGDIVYVPKEFIATINTGLDRFLPLLRVVTLGTMVTDILY